MVSSMQTKTKANAAARHSRIPSLSKRYVSTAIAKKDSLTVQHARNLTMPSRLTKKLSGSKMHTQGIPTSPLINKAITEVRNPQSALPDDIVTELLIDPFKAEDIYFEV